MEDMLYDDVMQQLVAAPDYPGLSQLICLAITNSDFAEKLLENPANAMRQLPEGVNLSSLDRQIVLSIPAGISDIQELAALLWRKIAQ